MEIEGIINHTLAGLEIKTEHLKKSIRQVEEDSYTWTCLRLIHVNKEIQNAIRDKANVRQLFSEEEHMKKFIANDPDETFRFLGFDLDDIQLYIQLRNYCRLR